MLYLTDAPPSFTFLLPFLRLILPLSTMENDRTSTPVPVTMDPKPPDQTTNATPPNSSPVPHTMPPPSQPTSALLNHQNAASSQLMVSPTSHLANAPSTQPTTDMDLELVQALEALQVSTRGTPASSSREQEESLDTKFNLILKILENQGSARPLTIHQVSQDLQQAWGTRYAAVSPIDGPYFLASFHNLADMIDIIRRQPWLVRRHNVLIELYIPNKRPVDYAFDHLYASVRLYGLPFEARTPQMIDAILRQIGQPSDLEE